MGVAWRVCEPLEESVPQDRFLHPRLGRSRKVSSLTDFESRVWSHGYLLCCDDFGVMPSDPALLRGFNVALGRRSDNEIVSALEAIVKVELLISFRHQSDEYVCDPAWQDFQKIRFPRNTLYPCPTSETLPMLSRNTLGLFQQFHEGFPKDFDVQLISASRYHTANGKRLLVVKDRRGVGGKELEAKLLALGDPVVWDGWPGGVPTPLAFVALYNARKPIECPRVTELSEGRIVKATKVLEARPEFSFWSHVMEQVGKSKLLRGLKPSVGHEHFLCDFDWLLQKGKNDQVENFVKVAEGRYSRDVTRKRDESWGLRLDK